MKHSYQSLFRDSSNGYARYQVIRNEAGEADDLRILDVNHAYENMMGWDTDENLVGCSVSELDHLIPDKWPVESIEFYDKAVSDNDSLTQTIEFTVKSTEKVYQIIVVPATEDELICRYHDITLVKDEAGALTLEEVPFNLIKTLQDLHGLFDKMAAQKEVEIILDIDDEVPERVEGDPHRFSQILNNLLGNALKYTKKGEIRIRATVDQEHQAPEGNEVTLKISVQDTGVGIPESSMDLLFQVFTQADPSNTRLYGGTGLGLPIAKNIVEHMGGTIWAESTRGEGSTFTFTVQLKLLMIDTVSA